MSDRLIDDYIHDLRMSAWLRGLPTPRTKVLETETRARIAAELTSAGTSDEAAVHGVLDRLGPASDIVDREGATPPTGIRAVGAPILTPLVRLRVILAARGWGAAEIGGLLLLIVGPFFVWWIGPIFGIILVRVAAERWSHRAEHNATVVVFALFGVHALIAMGLFVLALAAGGPLADEMQRVLNSVGPGNLGRGPGFSPVDYLSGPLQILAVVVGLLPIVAGISAGLYLALSPRQRR